ncbi:VOC family protein [Marinilongibacter aquaticus]|uniref:VOC family protein n=1 Tax=Marinilongibacter aquaticus TaxID=2975157 RepID=UPI0021BDEB33|nr:VOC family protein [Marinilongibacter aquaticus]UBM57526.1 VOC family protein [Marinilongibacter aquaticus]
MANTIGINHVTLVVNNLEEAAAFYEKEFGLEVIPAFLFDYPTAFFKINESQQLHLTEWEDAQSFRGHVCLHVDDINAIFWRMKELDIIDTSPWGKVRTLPDGPLQFFVRDPSGNLVEISCPPGTAIEPEILEDELFEEGLYVSGRNDFRGYKSKDATLYHGK